MELYTHAHDSSQNKIMKTRIRNIYDRGVTGPFCDSHQTKMSKSQKSPVTPRRQNRVFCILEKIVMSLGLIRDGFFKNRSSVNFVSPKICHWTFVTDVTGRYKNWPNKPRLTSV